MAAKALTFVEFLKFGPSYAKAVTVNAQVLAGALAAKGEPVLGENHGYTQSHQVALDVTKYGDGGQVEKKLENMNIIANRQLLPGDLQAGRHYTNPGGIRVGVSELTRLGHGEERNEGGRGDSPRGAHDGEGRLGEEACASLAPPPPTSEVLLRQLAGVLLPLGLPPDDEVGLGVLEITEF